MTGNTYSSLVDDIRKQLADRGDAHGTRSGKSSGSDKNLAKFKCGDPAVEGSRESRSVQQVVNFSTPSFPA